MNEKLNKILNSYISLGGSELILSKQVGSLVVDHNKVLMKNDVPGLKIGYKELRDSVEVIVKVENNTKIKNPVHLCFGMTSKTGKQVIRSNFLIGRNSSVKFVSHCIFPNAEKVEHIMDSKIKILDGGKMKYLEDHYHSEKGAVVKPRLNAIIGKNGMLIEEIKVIRGSVGLLDIDYNIHQEDRSSVELLAKVYGKKQDRIKIKDSIFLDGKFASGTTKTRIALTDSSKGEVFGEVVANAPFTRGHVDCQEILNGKSVVARSTPMIVVNDPTARVTHEAAIGRINRKELETLMARGLSKEEAMDFIVNGLMK